MEKGKKRRPKEGRQGDYSSYKNWNKMKPPGPIPIIDSHIHLYPASELASLDWCSMGHPLREQHSVDEYKAAAENALTPIANPRLRGFVFMETDRSSTLDPSGWEEPLRELAFMSRIILGKPLPGEGHTAGHASLCKAIIPWAPLPAGPKVLSEYFSQMQSVAGEAFDKIKGVRFLVQHKHTPQKPGQSLNTENFLESVLDLGDRGMAFDIGIDSSELRHGKEQLRDLFIFVDNVRMREEERGKSNAVLVINHMGKPRLGEPDIKPRATYPPRSDRWGPRDAGELFYEWENTMTWCAKFPKVYVKLSGAFSEMAKLQLFDEQGRERDAKYIYSQIGRWVRVVLREFGPKRIMFGSDWPVSTYNGDKMNIQKNKPFQVAGAWKRWKEVAERMFEVEKLDEEAQRDILGRTCAEAYGFEY